MSYDYEGGKKRIEEILNNKITVIENEKLPEVGNFTYDNAYYSWVSSIFVDIRDSTTLFSEEDKEKVAKIIRSFTSEVIDILDDTNLVRETGIRGDCVYGIYTTPFQTDIYEVFLLTATVNTLMEMLNKLLAKKGYQKIKVGIGMSTDQELVVKAGRKNKTDLNSKVWIGDAVTKASNLSSIGNKNFVNSVVISESSYDNFIDELEKKSSGKNPKSWFTKVTDYNLGVYYHGDIIINGFNEWVKKL